MYKDLPTLASSFLVLLVVPGCLGPDSYEVLPRGASFAPQQSADGRSSDVTYLPSSYGLIPAMLSLGGGSPQFAEADAASDLSLDFAGVLRSGKVREIVSTSVQSFELGNLLGTKLPMPTYVELFGGFEVTDENSDLGGDGSFGFAIKPMLSKKFSIGIGYARIGSDDGVYLSINLVPPTAGP